uniref:Uncharacterized protein n=2 Tax=Eptatretus burgeri TaxID=7764 RepID=A0A8C4QP55_EPTBU
MEPFGESMGRNQRGGRSATEWTGHIRERTGSAVDVGERTRGRGRQRDGGRSAIHRSPDHSRQGSRSLSESPVPLSPGGSSTPRRCRRQLPQTPATPRPNVTYSPVRRPGKSGTPPPRISSLVLEGYSPQGGRLREGVVGGGVGGAVVSPRLRRSDGPAAAEQRRRHHSSDPYLEMRGGELAGGRWGVSRTIYGVSPVILAPGRGRRIPNGHHCPNVNGGGGGGSGPMGPHLRAGSGLRKRNAYSGTDEDSWC